MTEEERKVIERALILVYDNENTSAHRLGLERRGENLRKIEEMLRDLIGVSEDELDTMYWAYVAREGR